MFFGTVSGGLSAEFTGDNFWQGAATGLVVSGLNHVVHKMQERNLVNERLKALALDPTPAAALRSISCGGNKNVL